MALELTDEVRGRLRNAQGTDEVAAILTDAGAQATEAEVERIAGELAYADEHDGEELSLDEMDAVAGGRDFSETGCAATVEPGSNCWGEDGGCTFVHFSYVNGPSKYKGPCGHYTFCDGRCANGDGPWNYWMVCPVCQQMYTISQEEYDAAGCVWTGRRG